MRSFSKKEALKFGWERFKERPFFLVGLFILTTVISAITGFVAEEITTGAVGVVVNLLDFAVQIILGMGMTLIMLRIYDKVDTDYTDLVEPLHLFWKYLVMTVLVLIVVLFGFVLFIIPGIIAGIALSFASYLIIDRNMGPIEAMKESMHITNGHRWNLFLFGLTIFLFNILGALFFGVGLLITIPISALATVHVYRWLLNPPSEMGVEVSTFAKVSGVVVMAVVIGLIALFMYSLGNSLFKNSPEARDAQRKSDLVELKLAAALYFDVNGAFPATIDQLAPEYINALPTDPGTGEGYNYTMFAEGTDYEVCTVLETVEDFGGAYCEFGLELGSGTPEFDFSEDEFLLE